MSGRRLTPEEKAARAAEREADTRRRIREHATKTVAEQTPLPYVELHPMIQPIADRLRREHRERQAARIARGEES